MQEQQQQPLTQQDFQSLLACLQNALNPNSELQKQAEAYIGSLDSRPGFSSALAEIVGNREADHSARYLASVHLKNSIHRNWRKRGGIGPEEKAHLRSKLSQLIPQDDNQIAVQVALVYAKVARFDYPGDWPGLFSDLMANLGSSNPLTARRVYLILHHVLKELSSKRLVADQANFAAVTELLFSHVWGQWCADTQLLLSGLPVGLEAQQPAQQLLQSCERWMLLLKILRRLILHGFPSDARTLAPVAAVHSCCPHMVAALQGLLGCRPRVPRPRPSQLLAMLDRSTLKLLKTLCQILEVHPWSFHGAGVLFPTMELCSNQLVEVAAAAAAAGPAGSGAGAGGAVERRLTQCCTALVTAMQCKSYKGTSGSLLEPGTGQPKDTTRLKQMSAELKAALQAFWAAPDTSAAAAGGQGGGSSRLVALVGSLVTRHMVLTKADLERWRDNPEEFAHAQGQGGTLGSWQDSLTLAAEQLYLVLLQTYREVLGPAVAALLPGALAAAPAGVPADSLPGEKVLGVPLQVLYKEAVYAALTAGAYELYDYLDFKAWMASSFMQELSDASAANRPIRRRVGLLVGANVERLEPDDAMRPALYNALLGLLSDQDGAVALAGASGLSSLLQDFNFEEGPFAPCLPPCLQLLLRLAGSSEELDTQKQAFALLNLVLERCSEAVRPHVMALAGVLPELWDRAAGQSLLRIQILETVQRLLNLLGPGSPALFPLVLPLLSYSLDVRQPEVLEGLLEDGLALWLVALRNAPHCCAPPTPPPQAPQGQQPGGPDAAAGGAAGAGGPWRPLDPALRPTLDALLAPFPALTGIAEGSTEHLPHIMSVLSSAALVAGPALFELAGQHVVAVLGNVVGNVSERGLLLTLPALEYMLQAAPEAAAAALQPVLSRLLVMVLGGKESSLVVANSLPVFGRLLLAAPGHFVALCGAAAADPAAAAALSGRQGIPQGIAPAEAVLWRLLEIWTDAFDSVGQAAARRLCALALCRALSLPSRVPLGMLDVLLPPVTAVWYEVEGGGGFSNEGLPPSFDYFSAGVRGGEDGLDEVAGPALDSEDAEGETVRRMQLREADPAALTSVSAALREGLAAAAALHGEAAVHGALGQLDPHVAAQVQQATTGTVVGAEAARPAAEMG